MKRLTVWLESQPHSLPCKQFLGGPFGDAYVTIDPTSQATFASGNRNRVHLCGAEAGMGPDSISRLIELFVSEGVGRFFVWLSPGPDMDRVRGWIEQNGLSRIRWTGYPTLYRTPLPPGASQNRSRDQGRRSGRHRDGQRATRQRTAMGGIQELRG